MKGLARLILLTCCLGMAACRENPTFEDMPSNLVVRYLEGAERQAETDAQTDNIRAALEDLRTLSPRQLARKRYGNYQLEPGQWTLGTVLRRHFVPRGPQYAFRDEEEARLYRDAQEPTARAVIAEHIRAILEKRQAYERLER